MSNVVAIGGAAQPLPARTGPRKAVSLEAPRSVRVALYLFVATIPFESFPISELLAGRFSLARAAGYLFFLIALVHARTTLRRPPAAVWWLAVWIAIVAAHIPRQDADLAALSLRHVLQLSQMVMLLWLASNVLRSPRAWRTVLVVLVCSCAALALVQAGGGVQLNEDEETERSTTLGENPNTIGTMYALAIVAAIAMAREIVAGWRRIALLLLCVPLAIQLVRTGSRAAMLAVVVGLIVMMIRSRGLGGKMKAALLGIPLLAALVLVILSSAAASERMRQMFEERRFARREYIVPTTIEMIRERPIFGWGPGLHTLELGSRLHREALDEHNLFLWVFNEGGVVAFIPFLIAVLLMTRDADRGRYFGRGTVSLALVATLALANMAHSYHNRKITWLLVAVAVSTPRRRLVGVPPAARQAASPDPFNVRPARGVAT